MNWAERNACTAARSSAALNYIHWPAQKAEIKVSWIENKTSVLYLDKWLPYKSNQKVRNRKISTITLSLHKNGWKFLQSTQDMLDFEAMSTRVAAKKTQRTIMYMINIWKSAKSPICERLLCKKSPKLRENGKTQITNLWGLPKSRDYCTDKTWFSEFWKS